MDDLIDRLRERVQTHPEQMSAGGGGSMRAQPPATVDQLRRSEQRLGFHLPPLLRRIYLEVANGGFGPAYGVMGVDGGFTDDLGHTVADSYGSLTHGDPEDQAWIWPRAHLPICHWGCVIYSIVDCGTDGNPVYWADISAKAPGEPMTTIILPHKATLEEWLQDWMDGKNLWKDLVRP